MMTNNSVFDEMTLDEFVSSGTLTMINQVLSWHGMVLVYELDQNGSIINFVPAKLKKHLMFDETEVVAEKRRMSNYMVKNAADLIYAENQ